MKLYTIESGFFRLDGGAMFGVVPKSLWNRLNPADENNMCNFAMRLLLVEEGNRLMLVDTGMGDKQDAKFFSHYYPHGDDSIAKSLAAHGFSVGDITDVLLSHLHFDHAGGAIKRVGDKLVPAFPNAVYWSNPEHWDWAVHPNAREKASFLPENILPIEASGQLQWIQSPLVRKDASGNTDLSGGLPFVPFGKDITIRFSDGHTRAMMLPQVECQGHTLIFAADLMPSTAHVGLPYIPSFDMFPLTILHEREALYKEALEKNAVLFLDHDPEKECCTLVQTEKGVRLGDSFKLNDLF